MPDNLLMPAETELSIFIHSVFDTGIIIDTYKLSNQQYRQYADQTLSLLQQSFPQAQWFQEDQYSLQGSDDAIDFLPPLNLSYISAICPTLLIQETFCINLSSNVSCTITFSSPTVYFQSFSAGIISFKAILQWNNSCTFQVLQEMNHYLLKNLASLVLSEEHLIQLVDIFSKQVLASKIPLYDAPFSNLMPAALHRNVLYWSHFTYTARTATASNIILTANWLTPLMMPIDQNGVKNMALKPNRYIFLGWGRSMVCYPNTIDDQTVFSYIRLLEIRNYIWKTLYDLDRGLRSAILQSRNIQSRKEAQALSNKLRSLDFRIKGVLEELSAIKMTFDHEKIWLIQQIDANWFTEELTNTVEKRLESFCEFYEYSEESIARSREVRLRTVLNLIGIVATTSAITTIVDYFDPYSHLAILPRLELLWAGLIIVLMVFLLAVVISRRVRSED